MGAQKIKGEDVVPNGETLVKLSNYFGVPIDFFLDDVETKKETNPSPKMMIKTIYSNALTRFAKKTALA